MIRRIHQIITRDVTQGVVGTIFLKVASGVVTFAMFSLAARSMTSDAFGHLVMLLSVAQIGCVVGMFGQEMLVVRSLNKYSVASEPSLIKGILLFSTRIALGLIILATLAVVIFSWLVLEEDWTMTLALALFMIVNAAIMLGSQVARSLVSILLGEGVREFLWRFLVTVVLLAALAMNRGISPEQFLYLSTAALTLGLIVQAAGIWNALPHDVRRSRPAFETKSWTASSVRFWLSSILEATSQYLDVVVVCWLLDPAAAGLYFAASRLANLFAMLLSALNTFAQRRLPALYFGGEHVKLDRLLFLMAEVTALCVVAGLLIFMFGAGHLLSLFGAAFVTQQSTLIVLAIGTAVQVAGGPAAAILLLTGHEGRYVPLIGANVALRLIGFLILIPMFGVLGAAIASTISLVIFTVALNVLCRRCVGLDPSILILLRRMGIGRLAPRPNLADTPNPSPPATVI